MKESSRRHYFWNFIPLPPFTPDPPPTRLCLHIRPGLLCVQIRSLRSVFTETETSPSASLLPTILPDLSPGQTQDSPPGPRRVAGGFGVGGLMTWDRAPPRRSWQGFTERACQNVDAKKRTNVGRRVTLKGKHVFGPRAEVMRWRRHADALSFPFRIAGGGYKWLQIRMSSVFWARVV